VIGADGFDSVRLLLNAVGGAAQPRMRNYLRKARTCTALGAPK
jgi:hypothetical protein